jgi:hypothetical protein
VAVLLAVVLAGGCDPADIAPDRSEQSDESPADAETSGAADAIPGLYPVDVYGNLTDKGFESTDATEGVYSYEDRNARRQYQVEIFADTPNEVNAVDAMSQRYTPGDPDQTARRFLGFVASLPYEGAKPKQARNWVENNVGSTDSTVINGVKFNLSEGGTTRMLRIHPADRKR